MAEAVNYESVSASQQRQISVQRMFEICLLLMLATAFLTLSTTGRVDAASIVLFSAALGVKLRTYARREFGFRLELKAINRICVAYLAFLVLDLLVIESGLTPAGRLLAATVHLILFVTVMKVFSARRYRDFLYLAALSFLMILAAAVLTARPEFVAGLALYVLFSIGMFSSFEIKNGMDCALSPPPGPYPQPARNRAAIEKSLLRTSLALTLGIAAVGSVLFFAIPRFHASYLGRFAGPAGSVTGFSSRVDLGEMGAMLRSSRVVMRIEPEGDRKAFAGVYWRGIALAGFTGRTWYQAVSRLTELRPSPSHTFVLPPPAAKPPMPHRVLRYRVLLSGVSTDVLFAAGRPLELTGPFDFVNLDASGSLHGVRRGDGPVQYSVISEEDSPQATLLRRDARSAPQEISSRDLQLPKLDPRIGELARRITSSDSNNYDRSLDIERYLQRNFRYTLNPRNINRADPIGSFLFTAKEGYCSYFAAAMAIMLRTLGVPARVVNGFQTGEYNPVGRDFVVRARDAHSWVEVYFAGYGWVTFDPTPAGAAETPALSRIDDYMDAASLFWSEWVLNYDARHQTLLRHEARAGTSHLYAAALEWVRAEGPAATRAAKRAIAGLRKHDLALACGLALIVLMSLGFLLRLGPLGSLSGIRISRRVRRKPTPASEASAAYDHLLRILSRRGIERPTHQTPRELAASLSDSTVGVCVGDFTRLYYEMRFGQRCVPPGSFDTLIRELRRSLRHSGRGARLTCSR